MDRYRAPLFTVAIAPVLLVAAFVADAQPPRGAARIGFLSSSAVERETKLLGALQQGLRDLGYEDGKTIVIEPRYAAGKFERLPGLAAELVRLKVDVLVVTGAPAAHAAKNATSSIPIVMTNAADPVGTGLVASLARPGGNVTGLSDFNAGVVTKRLELLKEVVPSASHIAVLLNPANPTNPLQLKLLQNAAPALGVTVRSFETKVSADIDRAFSAMKNERAEALVVVGDPMFGDERRKIAELSVTGRLPAIHSSRPTVDAGGLMSYGVKFEELYRRAAAYVDKILKGASPADLPVEQPSTFELVVNLRAARALGLRVPPSVLLRADHVIE